jgi:hypothetical protein
MPITEGHERMFTFNLNLDKEILEKHFAPRLHLHKEQAHQILQQEQHRQQKKETAILLGLLIAEPYTRSQIKDALKTSQSNEELVKRLAPFHRDIQALLDEARQEVFNFSEPMQEIVAKEKDTYQQLLEELTELIRQHSLDTNPLNAAQQTAFSPIKNVIEQAEEKIAVKELLTSKADEVIVTVTPEDFQRVMDAFLPYMAPEQKEALSALFAAGHSSEIIYFKGPNKQLGDFFRRLKDKGILLGISYYTELAEWLSQHFYFKNKDKGGFTPVSRKSILKVLQDGDRPKDIIKF